MSLRILPGAESFQELRRAHACYIDKTAFIDELLTPLPAKASLITRPRRFGKTLGMSTLETFLSIEHDHSALFHGLYIEGKNRSVHNGCISIPSSVSR